MDQVNAAIIATLSYSDIFDYPLTKAELWRYLIHASRPPIKMSHFETSLQQLVYGEKIHYQDAYYFFAGRKSIVATRVKRKKISQGKMKKASKIVKILTAIPTVEFIGISGSLAMGNAETDADIDIFLITKRHTLWITRLFVLCILQIKNIRRKPIHKKKKDTICANMLIDTGHLRFPSYRQDIYTAHEIMQMRPIFSRDNIYEKLLQQNAWITTYIPNSFPATRLQQTSFSRKNNASIFQSIEPMAKFFQIWYMKRHRTIETIKEGFVAFHPFDYRKKVYEEWEKRKKKYGL